MLEYITVGALLTLLVSLIGAILLQQWKEIKRIETHVNLELEKMRSDIREDKKEILFAIRELQAKIDSFVARFIKV